LVPDANIVIDGSGANRTVTVTPAANANGGPVTITVSVSDGTSSSTETFDVTGERKPGSTLTLVITRRDGERVEVPVTCRLDTAEEVSIYEAGGVLQRFARDFLESAAVA